MVKKIIIGCMVLTIGITGVFVFNNENLSTKDNVESSLLVKEKSVAKVKDTSKKEDKEVKEDYYVQTVPMINQEYTILEDKEPNDTYDSSKENDYIKNAEPIKIESEDINEETIASSDNLNSEDETLSTIETNKEDDPLNDNTKEEDINGLENELGDDEIKNSVNEEIKLDISGASNDVLSIKNTVKNGFYKENESTYYYENDVKVTGLKSIDGVNNYFSPSGKYLGTNNIKVVDVSYYQGDINWDLFASESDCYGVILRLGYWNTLDKKFERNINELKRLNIPYGIYLFSYASSLNGAKTESDFTNDMIDKYDLNPTLGIYYDIESWKTNTGNSDNISKARYDEIIQLYINSVSNHTSYKYKVKVYSGRWYAMNRLGSISKKHVDWVAEYNSTCKYDGVYSMWQYTSKGRVPGIEGNVDISYIL